MEFSIHEAVFINSFNYPADLPEVEEDGESDKQRHRREDEADVVNDPHTQVGFRCQCLSKDKTNVNT